MYEMLFLFKLIKRNSKKLNAFYLCEAPGGFIFATNHYIHTQTKITDFVWHAQSLNPKKGRNIIGDKFKLIKKYKNNWDFGPTGTGDITQVKNIKHYKKYICKADLVTSDCGMAMSSDTFTRDLNISEKVLYCSILTILNGLASGKNIVVKNYMELSPIKVSLIYILFQSFRRLYFYKSLQNPMSTEFYIVGINFNGIDKKILTSMFSFLENFNYEKSLFSEYPDNFLYQLNDIYGLMVKQQTTTIERTLYYMDNYDEISKKNNHNMNDIIYQKNLDWVKKFRINSLNIDNRL